MKHVVNQNKTYDKSEQTESYSSVQFISLFFKRSTDLFFELSDSEHLNVSLERMYENQ